MVPNDLPVPPSDAAVKIYEAYLADLGRIGDRQQTLRTFYVSLIGALTGLLALAGGDKAVFANAAKGTTGLLVCATGFVVCLMWLFHMRSFGRVYAAKFATLKAMEAGWPVTPFTTEACKLKPGHWRMSDIDQVVAAGVAVAFALLFVVGLFATSASK